MYGVSSDLVGAIIRAESAYASDAVSPKGAQGLMQLMPETALSYGVSDSFDAEQNIRGGVHHLSDLIEKYDGDVKLALAAYNAGEGAVQKYGGIPPYRETIDYIQKIELLMSSSSE
jgi:soluble lytic murein transglycosylase-like protein